MEAYGKSPNAKLDYYATIPYTKLFNSYGKRIFMTAFQIVLLVLFSIYYGLVGVFFFRVLLENKNPLKTQSYLLLMVLLPVIGLLIYLFFGVNFRRKKLFSRKVFRDQKMIKQWIEEYENLLSQSTDNVRGFLQEKAKLPFLIWRNNYSVLSENNRITILNNGENKFPKLISKLEEANNHIHLEYYKFEEDQIGKSILELLMKKASAGVKVRIIVDALGSNHISDSTIKTLKTSGVDIREYNPVLFSSLANRVNYRDHRKIVIIDGKISFVGGMNVADKYINSGNTKHFWRDTHCMIEGEATYSLQILFLLNWYFVSKQLIKPSRDLFPKIQNKGNTMTAIISSDPDSDFPNLMETYFSMITSAREEILISTPYFIPNESILTALKTSAKGGVKVILILPKVSDSALVHSASLTFLGELMRNDIDVYMYKKGMIHSKVMIIDGELSSIGTANMDYRSFDNNAEVNALFFDESQAQELKSYFETDLANSVKLQYRIWRKRPLKIRLLGSIGRLIAPVL